METTPDALRLMALHLIERARELLADSVSPQEAVVRAYNEGCCDYQEDGEVLHPQTDRWITAHHLALGVLHEASLDRRASGEEQLRYASGTLQMLVGAVKG